MNSSYLSDRDLTGYNIGDRTKCLTQWNWTVGNSTSSLISTKGTNLYFGFRVGPIKWRLITNHDVGGLQFDNSCFGSTNKERVIMLLSDQVLSAVSRAVLQLVTFMTPCHASDCLHSIYIWVVTYLGDCNRFVKYSNDSTIFAQWSGGGPVRLINRSTHAES